MDWHRTLDAPVDKLARNYRILSRTVTAPTPLLLVAQQSHRFHWYPAGQQCQRQSLVIWTLTSDLSGTSLHSIFWLRVLCRMPFLKHPPHFSPGLGPAQLLLW